MLNVDINLGVAGKEGGIYLVGIFAGTLKTIFFKLTVTTT
jgi:hypothetical protein